jgi:hypothetical protein
MSFKTMVEVPPVVVLDVVADTMLDGEPVPIELIADTLYV